MQSHRQSLIEAITNVVVGYALAVITQIVVFPWFGLQVSLGDNLAIGAVFVMISLLRRAMRYADCSSAGDDWRAQAASNL